jgi:hypothetical protein
MPFNLQESKKHYFFLGGGKDIDKNAKFSKHSRFVGCWQMDKLAARN